MDYMIFDSTGDAIESFKVERRAIEALVERARGDVDAARELILLAFDRDGIAVGEAVTVADVLPEMATSMRVTVNGDATNSGALTIRETWRNVAGRSPVATSPGYASVRSTQSD